MCLFRKNCFPIRYGIYNNLSTKLMNEPCGSRDWMSEHLIIASLVYLWMFLLLSNTMMTQPSRAGTLQEQKPALAMPYDVCQCLLPVHIVTYSKPSWPACWPVWLPGPAYWPVSPGQPNQPNGLTWYDSYNALNFRTCLWYDARKHYAVRTY